MLTGPESLSFELDMTKSDKNTSKTAKNLFGDPEDLLIDRAERASRQWQREVPSVADKLQPWFCSAASMKLRRS